MDLQRWKYRVQFVVAPKSAKARHATTGREWRHVLNSSVALHLNLEYRVRLKL